MREVKNWLLWLLSVDQPCASSVAEKRVDCQIQKSDGKFEIEESIQK
jgi:hypothetical protein